MSESPFQMKDGRVLRMDASERKARARAAAYARWAQVKDRAAETQKARDAYLALFPTKEGLDAHMREIAQQPRFRMKKPQSGNRGRLIRRAWLEHIGTSGEAS